MYVYYTTTYVVYTIRQSPFENIFFFNGAAQSSEREYKGDDISDGQGRRRQRHNGRPYYQSSAGAVERVVKTDHFSCFEFSRGFFFLFPDFF